jgi:hypothetical protein
MHHALLHVQEGTNWRTQLTTLKGAELTPLSGAVALLAQFKMLNSDLSPKACVLIGISITLKSLAANPTALWHFPGISGSRVKQPYPSHPLTMHLCRMGVPNL